MMSLGRVLLLATLVGLVVATGVSHAQTPVATKQHAQDLFVRGVSLSKQNRWRDALAAFEESGRLYPHPRTRFNIGYCERGLGRWTRARKRFREAIEMDRATPAKDELSATMKDAADRYLRDAEASIGAIELRLPESGTKVSIDGRPIERLASGRGVAGTREPGPPEPAPERVWIVDVDAGAHVLIAVSGARRVQVDVQVIAGETITIAPELPAASEGAAKATLPNAGSVPPRGPASAEARPLDDTLQLVGAGVVGGLGVLGVVSGALLLSRAFSLHAEADEACPNDPLCPDDRAYGLANDARKHGNLATASFVVGGVGMACSVFLLLTAPSIGLFGDDVALSPSPSGLRVHGRF